MNAKYLFALGAVLLTVVGASCATSPILTAAGPPEVKVAVVNFMPTVDFGGATEINFSVANLTGREMTGLTLLISLNPSNGLEVPYYEKTIDRIEPGASWNPGPFMVRGRVPGTTSVFFTVIKDGVVIGRDYALVGVGPDDTFLDRPY
jgi:hypothetical protein